MLIKESIAFVSCDTGSLKFENIFLIDYTNEK